MIFAGLGMRIHYELSTLFGVEIIRGDGGHLHQVTFQHEACLFVGCAARGGLHSGQFCLFHLVGIPTGLLAKQQNILLKLILEVSSFLIILLLFGLLVSCECTILNRNHQEVTSLLASYPQVTFVGNEAFADCIFFEKNRPPNDLLGNVWRAMWECIVRDYGKDR